MCVSVYKDEVVVVVVTSSKWSNVSCIEILPFASSLVVLSFPNNMNLLPPNSEFLSLAPTMATFTVRVGSKSRDRSRETD